MRQVIIIGSGPAGYTAAIYAARAQLEPLLIASSVEAGGELMNTTEVENFPGFPDGIMGPDLMDNMLQQAEEVRRRDRARRRRRGRARRRRQARARRRGQVPQGLRGPHRHLRDRLRLPQARPRRTRTGCPATASPGAPPATGSSSVSKEIAVVGGGDSAMEEATFLTRFADKVYVIHRRDTLRASKIMQDRAFADPKIEFAGTRRSTEINGGEHVDGVRSPPRTGERGPRAAAQRRVHRDRQRPAHRARHGQLELTARGHHRGRGPLVPHHPARRLRRGRRDRPDLPSGGHRRRLRHGRRARRRALPGRAARQTCCAGTGDASPARPRSRRTFNPTGQLVG